MGEQLSALADLLGMVDPVDVAIFVHHVLIFFGTSVLTVHH